MTTKWIEDFARPRTIVKIAAQCTKNEKLKHWFTYDEKGKWETLACKWLHETANKAASLGLTEAQVNQELAERLFYLGSYGRCRKLQETESKKG
jgi:long-subunit acyl-CoA synthetase (AMP-forming)